MSLLANLEARSNQNEILNLHDPEAAKIILIASDPEDRELLIKYFNVDGSNLNSEDKFKIKSALQKALKNLNSSKPMFTTKE